MVAVNLLQGDSVDKSKVDYRDALPVNMYGVPKQILGAAGYMYQIPGLTQFGTASDTSRGALWVTLPALEGHYRVHGANLIAVDDEGSTTTLGTIPGTGPVSMTSTFNNVIVVANQELFYYNPTDGFRQIVDNATTGSVIGNPISTTYVSSIVMLTDGERIYHSSFDEVSGVPGEEVFTVSSETIPEFQNDQVWAVHQAENDECIVFKAFSIESFFLTGGTGFAFSPSNQKATRLGVVGTRSMALLKGNWYFVGGRKETDLSVWAYSQGSSQKIATREIEQILAEYSREDLENITVDAFEYENIPLVIIHLPNETLLYNGALNSWSILKSDASGDTTYRAKDFVHDPRISQWIVGDKQNGNIGLLDDTVATHYGDIAELILFTAFLKLETASIDKIEIETIPGLTDSTNDATVFVSRTDNGRTYSQEYSMLYGDQYDYNQRFIAYRLGYVRDWMAFKFRAASRSRMAFALFNVEMS